MTVTHETGSGVSTIVVRDGAGPLSFQGETIADLSWDYGEAEGRGHVRWTDISLHKVYGNARYSYVIQVVGRSVVYHKPGLPCQRGINTRVGRLREDDDRYAALVACNNCAPTELDDLADGNMVAVEQDIPTLHKCVDARDVVDVMQRRSRDGVMSGINLKILQTASALDVDIAVAMSEMRGL